jgi:4-hydroxy-tetrahydrodipicolinate reductase
MATISIYGAGQLATGVSKVLQETQHRVSGPYSRADRLLALESGADVVIIATTTKFAEVAGDIETALNAGSNVLVSSEECADPFSVDLDRATELSDLAKAHGLSVAGCGVNPGLIFDSLVLTLLGASPRGCAISISRTVSIAGFGTTVLRRLGVGRTTGEFELAVENGEILGHAGFPQSMHVVASAIGVKIDRIEKILSPILTDTEIDIPGRFRVAAGSSVGVIQTYTAVVSGKSWFTSHFYGHVDLASVGKSAVDEISLTHGDSFAQKIELKPGIGAQLGSQMMVANSIERIIKATPGWVTVAQMVPAFPENIN